MEGIFYNFERNAKSYQKNISLKKSTIVANFKSDGIEFKRPENLLYFKKPKTSCYPLDLNEGYENYKFRYDTYDDQKMKKIEEFLIHHGRDDEVVTRCEDKTRVYTQRGVLLDIMRTPYKKSCNDFKIKATKFKDAIFINSSFHPYGTHCKTKRDTHHFKLRQFCFSDSPTTQPETATPIDENIQIYCVYRNEFDFKSQPDRRNFEIFYSAETSGIISETEIKPNNLEELNKCRFVHTKLLTTQIVERMPWRKSLKILTWWVQAHLCNVQDIYFGILDRNGYVPFPIQHVSVNELPKEQRWKPEVCFDFLYKFLTLLADKMADVNCPYTVYELKFLGNKERFDYKIRVYEGKTEESFLSEELIQCLQSSV